MQRIPKVKTKVDKLGRVVIPKKMRQALKIEPNSTIEIGVVEGHLEIVAEAPGWAIEQHEDGWPVLRLLNAEDVAQSDAAFENLDCRDDRSPEDMAAWH